MEVYFTASFPPSRAEPLFALPPRRRDSCTQSRFPRLIAAGGSLCAVVAARVAWRAEAWCVTAPHVARGGAVWLQAGLLVLAPRASPNACGAGSVRWLVRAGWRRDRDTGPMRDDALVVAHQEGLLLHVDAALAEGDDIVEPLEGHVGGLEGHDVDA